MSGTNGDGLHDDTPIPSGTPPRPGEDGTADAFRLRESLDVHGTLTKLAGGIGAVASAVEAHRKETAAGFAKIDGKLDRLLAAQAEADEERGRQLAHLARLEGRASYTEEQVRDEIAQRSAVSRAWGSVVLFVNGTLERHKRLARVFSQVLSWTLLLWVTAKPELVALWAAVRSLFSLVVSLFHT